MGLILDISPRTLEKVLYFASYVVLDPGVTSLQYKQVLSEKEYREEVEKYGSSTCLLYTSNVCYYGECIIVAFWAYCAHLLTPDYRERQQWKKGQKGKEKR